MTNIQEKIDALVDERSLLLTSKINIVKNQDISEKEKNFIFKYLSNPTSDFGIMRLFSGMAKELNYWDHSDFDKPHLLRTQTEYASELRAQMELAVSANGDGDMYKLPNPSVLVKTSKWLTDNGRKNNNFNLSALGLKLTTLRSALDNLRTIRSTSDGLTPPGYPSRDFYANPQKATIIGLLTDIKAILAAGRTSLVTETDALLATAQTNPHFTNPDMTGEIPSISGFGATLSSWETQVQDKITFLNGTYNRTTFDAFLGFTSQGTIYTFLTNLQNMIMGRVASLLQSFSGETGLRTWYYFWMEVLIGKPQSTFVTSAGLETAYQSTIDSLVKKKAQLETLYGSQVDKYLPTPSVVAVFRDEELKIKILFSSMPCFSEVSLYRKKITNATQLTNTPWTTGKLYSSEVSSASLVLPDESVVQSDSLYAYRVEVADSGLFRIDTFDTASQQSPLIEEEGIPYTRDETNMVLTVGEHTLTAGGYVFVPSQGIFHITGKTSLTITIDRPLLVGGVLYKANGIFAS